MDNQNPYLPYNKTDISIIIYSQLIKNEKYADLFDNSAGSNAYDSTIAGYNKNKPEE